jgi:death on curing protein
MTILYFDSKHAIIEHDNIITISGGRHGVLDSRLLESVLTHIQNDSYYLNINHKLTHLVFSVAMNHAFVDGNKRSSIALGAYFLEINGYDFLVGKFILEMENIVLWVAQGLIDKEFLFVIISDLIETSEISEETKLRLLNLF